MKTFIGYTVTIFLLMVWTFTGKLEGTISNKYAKTTWGDSVYFFVINGKTLEVSRRNYYLYNAGDYFKQGPLE